MASSPLFLVPFLLLFSLLISTTPPPPPPPPVPPGNRTLETQAEINALTAFRVALHDLLGALARWDPSSPSAPCSWCGVLCSPSSSLPRIVELRLPHLSGPICDSLAAGLPFLQKLSLRQNSFSGPIPVSLSRLSRLRSLFLQFSSFTRPAPPPSSPTSPTSRSSLPPTTFSPAVFFEDRKQILFRSREDGRRPIRSKGRNNQRSF